VVQTILLPEEKRDAKVLGQAQRLLTRSLAPIEESLAGKEYLIGNFSAADIMLGHSIFMSNRCGCVTDEMINLKAYIGRIEQRPAFQKAMAS
jgi:glutathione S-transferase